jgi:hypothetical protein
VLPIELQFELTTYSGFQPIAAATLDTLGHAGHVGTAPECSARTSRGLTTCCSNIRSGWMRSKKTRKHISRASSDLNRQVSACGDRNQSARGRRGKRHSAGSVASRRSESGKRHKSCSFSVGSTELRECAVKEPSRTDVARQHSPVTPTPGIWSFTCTNRRQRCPTSGRLLTFAVVRFFLTSRCTRRAHRLLTI